MKVHRLESRHPEPGELASFLDGTLDPDERDGILRHLDACATCREVAAVAVKVLDVEIPRPGRSWVGPVVAAAAAVMLLALPLSRVADPLLMTSEVRSVLDEGARSFDVLEPVRGDRVTGQPVFRWESVEDGATYHLLITDDRGDEVYATRTQETTVEFPTEAALQPGRYLWVVDALLDGAREATTGVRQFTVAR